MAADCGFELAGISPALPLHDFARFEAWRQAGMAGEMAYLTDRRGDLRSDPRILLGSAQSIICVGKLYNTTRPYSIHQNERRHGVIARYAWGDDYHDVVRAGMEQLLSKIKERAGFGFESKICVDTAPLLERSYARMAGLGWIGRNTCLINQQQGSWFLLGELLVSLPLAPDAPPPDRCGTCRRCIDACPTGALVPDGAGGWRLDSRLCISYLTIEQKGDIPVDLATHIGNLVFGCDICQDVCPWNRRAPVTEDRAFLPRHEDQCLQSLAALDEQDFRELFRASPIWRSKYAGFLRNVAAAMGNAGSPEMLEPLVRLTSHPSELVRRTAARALSNLRQQLERTSACV